MLRAAIAGIAIALVAVALVITMHDRHGWPLLAGALLFAGGCMYERRYHAARNSVIDSRFRPSGERFVDPETGRVTAAWVDPATGERRYSDEGVPPSPPA